MQTIPGLLDSNYEFLNIDNQTMFIHNGQIKNFTEAPISVIIMLKEFIEKNPDVKKILNEWHPNSEFNQLQQFAKCRFGGLDVTPDIENGNFQDGEYWDCPNSGKCAAEGILCKLPTFNGNVLTKIEIQLIKLSTTDLTNDVIAEKLNLALGTYHKMKSILHKKLDNILTKQSLTKLAYQMNLI